MQLTNVNEQTSNQRVIAAFDIGSNSIKMTAARRDDESRIAEFLWRSETVRLGAGIESSGRLAEDRIEAAMSALIEFASEARAAGASRLIGVATEAARVAENGEDFLQRVRTEIGLELATITGDREAELTYRGLQVEHDLYGDVVIADVGGGSTEVIIATGGVFQSGRSIPLGSGRLTDRLVEHDPPTGDEIATCRAAAGEALKPLGLTLQGIDRLIVVGGTGEYLTRLLEPDKLITIDEVDQVIDRLTKTLAHDLAEVLTIPESRARVLPAGVAIIRELAERLQPTSIEGARSGIRTGLLMAAFAGEL